MASFILGREGRGVIWFVRARRTEAERTVETASVFPDRDYVTLRNVIKLLPGKNCIDYLVEDCMSLNWWIMMEDLATL